MKPEFVFYILRLILCNERVLTWLKAEATKSDTPIDDYAVALIEELLCQK